MTAYSLEDAQELLKRQGPWRTLHEIKGVIEDVDASTLDNRHIQVNMGPTNFRSIWYPCLNLRESSNLTTRSFPDEPPAEGK